MASRKFIVAGIGTEIGKTICSAILCESLKADYWKPIQAGELDQSDSNTIKRLITNESTKIQKEAYRLQSPMSPHASAKIDGITIDKEKLILPTSENDLIIELAGGLMVPLTKDYLNIDWIQETGLPVILVSNYYLGSINHTLLSLEILKSRKIPLAGLIFNGEKTSSTFDVIMHRTDVDCLLEIPWIKELSKETIASYATKLKL